MKEEKEFFVPYIEGSLGKSTWKTIQRFAWAALGTLVLAAFIFGLVQKQFKNGTFELGTETKIIGVYHESPYPMLKVQLGENDFKNIVLLGFGKSSANPFLKEIRKQVPDLSGKTLSIEGNLIYYNGKTLIQITNEEKVRLVNGANASVSAAEPMGSMQFEGEIVDPKCYFGVMKPGLGKIHRSCAVLCISGGIPPVLATTDENDIATYFLLTDKAGKPINKEILPFIGKPSKIIGDVEKIGDWHILRIDVSDIVELNRKSAIY